MDDNEKIDGLTKGEWAAIYRPGIQEFAATRFTFTREAANLVRIAFGNHGAYVDANTREAVYNVAISLPPEIAVDLAGLLLKLYASPESDPSKTSGDL